MPLAALAAVAEGETGRRASADLAARLATLARQGLTIDAASAAGIRSVMSGDAATAAAAVHQALAGAAPGPQGWLLPVEPLLRTSGDPKAWAGALARLRTRAA